MCLSIYVFAKTLKQLDLNLYILKQLLFIFFVKKYNASNTRVWRIHKRGGFAVIDFFLGGKQTNDTLPLIGYF